MAQARIEHVNITVSDPQRTAKLMKELFGWDPLAGACTGRRHGSACGIAH